jgi:glycerol-3-phosphate dehydrogenase
MNRSRGPDFHTEGKSLSWSALDRPEVLKQATNRDFDLVILGGGITGAGVAREAALRGLSFLLVDKEDFAFGTSSRSSRLVHGGLRYLPQGDLRLVRESATERNWLHAALPNLVRPLGFYYCAFRGGQDTPFTVRVGLLLYQFLASTFARFPTPGGLRFLKPEDMARQEPTFKRQGLRLAGRYFDTATDDARLVIETLKEARALSGGRSVALSYVRAEGLLRSAGRVCGVELEDRLEGRRFQVRAGCVVNATGVWTGETLTRAGLDPAMLRPTKGVHVVVPTARVGNRRAFSLRCAEDGRFVFLLNRGDVSVIGTTDTDYHGDLDHPRCEPEERDYLLRTVNAYFPEAHLGPADVLSSYAGLRPLLAEAGSPSDVSRQHLVLDAGDGLVTITGGKLTTFRIMAFETLKQCAKAGYLRPLRGGEAHRDFSHRPYRVGLTWEAFEDLAREHGLAEALPEATRRHLHQKYGHGALGILQEVHRCPALGEPLLAGQPFCAAEIHHILAFEQPVHLADVMARRTEMQGAVARGHQAALARKVADLMAVRHGWEDTRKQLELESYLNAIPAILGP